MTRHSYLTRITHAAFSVAFFGLVFTGIAIYLHKHWIPHTGLVHEVFAVLMMASGLVYLVQAALSGGLARLYFTADDIAGIVPMTAYYLRLRNSPPAYVAYNPLQKLAYTAVLLFIAPLIVATGAALFFHVRAAGIWHLGFAIELVLFFAGHMVMVATTGLRSNLREMFTASGALQTLPHSDNARPQSPQTETPTRFAPSPRT